MAKNEGLAAEAVAALIVPSDGSTKFFGVTHARSKILSDKLPRVQVSYPTETRRRLAEGNLEPPAITLVRMLCEEELYLDGLHLSQLESAPLLSRAVIRTPKGVAGLNTFLVQVDQQVKAERGHSKEIADFGWIDFADVLDQNLLPEQVRFGLVENIAAYQQHWVGLADPSLFRFRTFHEGIDGFQFRDRIRPQVFDLMGDPKNPTRSVEEALCQLDPRAAVSLKPWFVAHLPLSPQPLEGVA